MDFFSFMFIYPWLAFGLALLIFKVAVDRTLSLRSALAKIKKYPGRIPLWVNPSSSPIVLLLGLAFPRPGMAGYLAAKFSLYRSFGASCFASVLMSTAQPYFWLADPEAIKLVVSDRHTFQRDIFVYQLINIYGKNLVGVEGPEWKRHRSVAKSAFNEANVALVWLETMRVVDEWFEQLDVVGPHVAVDTLHSMEQITLFVVVSAAFGKQLSFTTDSTAELPPGCKLSFQSAVLSSMKNIIFRALAPRWFYTLSSLIKVPYLSDRALFTQLAFDDLRTHMLDLVASARAEIVSGQCSAASGAALLRNLVEANMSQDGDSKRLTEDELLSNIFVFLLAGYETTAHTSSFAFLLLALCPESQEKIYEEVTRIWPADAPVTQLATCHKECMEKLEYTSACARETLRLLPAVSRLPKEVHTDTVLPGTYFTPGSVDNPSVETGSFSMAIPAGSAVVLDIWALHTNPLYWGDDAGEFKPERFIDTESYQWPRNAYLPFSGGARSCIGQKFAFAEMVGIIARVVHRYRILVPDDLANKPLEVQREVLLACKVSKTLAPTNARIKLCRRT